MKKIKFSLCVLLLSGLVSANSFVMAADNVCEETKPAECTQTSYPECKVTCPPSATVAGKPAGSRLKAAHKPTLSAPK